MRKIGEETYSRVKQSPTDSKETPHVDHQTESKRQANVQQHARIGHLENLVGICVGIGSIGLVTVVRNAGAAKGKEEEHECACELC